MKNVASKIELFLKKNENYSFDCGFELL